MSEDGVKSVKKNTPVDLFSSSVFTLGPGCARAHWRIQGQSFGATWWARNANNRGSLGRALSGVYGQSPWSVGQGRTFSEAERLFALSQLEL